MRNNFTISDEKTVDNGKIYCCAIDFRNRNRTGKIYTETGEDEWSYASKGQPLRYSLRNPLNKPDFIVSGADEKPNVCIRRVSFVPSRFHILEKEKVVGHIFLRSILQNKYTIDIEGLETCVFRMPLFTTQFHGEFKAGTGVWVIVGPGKILWSVLMRPEVADVRLLSAIAFIHWQWFNYN